MAKKRTTPMNHQSQTPSLELKAGSIRATAWPKEVTHNDKKWVEHSIRIQKCYKDERSGEWKTTTYFRREDMPKLALIANKVFEYLILKEEHGGDESSSKL